MSASKKRLAVSLALVGALLIWEARVITGPPPPWWDLPLVLGLYVGLSLLLCRLRAGPLLVLLALLGPVAYAPAPQPPRDQPSAPGDRDRVLITIDTLRADHALDLDGSWRVYEQAVASSSWTLPSMLSLMTSTDVRRHRGGLPTPQGWTEPEPMEWLAEQIDGRSAAFVCNPYLRHDFGFDRGFDRFEHADSWREPFSLMFALRQWRKRALGGVERQRQERDAHLVDEAIAWWQANPPGRFLWLHLLGPHEHRRDTQDPEDPYGGNVRATQVLVDRLLAAIGPDALVLLTSDHGEALGEGGRQGHGLSFDEEQIRVPLAIRGVEPGRVSLQVSLIDAGEVLLSGDSSTLDRGRPVVELGGLHRELAWAARVQGGGLLQRGEPAPSDDPQRTTWLSEELEASLRELGYESP